MILTFPVSEFPSFCLVNSRASGGGGSWINYWPQLMIELS